MTIALVCTAVLGGLLFGLGLVISLRRFFTKDFYFGAGGPTSFTTQGSGGRGGTGARSESQPHLAAK